MHVELTTTGSMDRTSYCAGSTASKRDCTVTHRQAHPRSNRPSDYCADTQISGRGACGHSRGAAAYRGSASPTSCCSAASELGPHIPPPPPAHPLPSKSTSHTIKWRNLDKRQASMRLHPSSSTLICLWCVRPAARATCTRPPQSPPLARSG